MARKLRSSDATARGGFLNLSLQTTRAHMVRAILEGVAFNMRWVLPAVESFVEQRFDELLFSGGGAVSDAWSQIMADVMDRPVAQLADARYVNNRATAFLAFVELGVLATRRHRQALPDQAPLRAAPRASRAVRQACSRSSSPRSNRTGRSSRRSMDERSTADGIDSIDVRQLLTFAVQIAEAAAPIALRYFRAPLDVQNKLAGGGYDPVTRADREVEAFFRAAIERRFPEHAIIGEEHGQHARARSDQWIIDPIDGTRAFISGCASLGHAARGRARRHDRSPAWSTSRTCTRRFYGDRARRVDQARRQLQRLRTRPTARLADAILYSTHPATFTGPADRARLRSASPRAAAHAALRRRLLFVLSCWRSGRSTWSSTAACSRTTSSRSSRSSLRRRRDHRRAAVARAARRRDRRGANAALHAQALALMRAGSTRGRTMADLKDSVLGKVYPYAERFGVNDRLPEKGRPRADDPRPAAPDGAARRTTSGRPASAPGRCTAATSSTTRSSTRRSRCTRTSTCCSATCARARRASRARSSP